MRAEEVGGSLFSCAVGGQWKKRQLAKEAVLGIALSHVQKGERKEEN